MKKSTKHLKPSAPTTTGTLPPNPAPPPTTLGESQTDSQTDSPSAYSEYSVVPPSTPNQKSETINQKSTLPEFSSLPPDQLDYIHDLLRTKTYEDAQQEIWATLGCRISITRLHRYRQKIDLAAALEIAGEDTLTASDQLTQLNDLLAGRETNLPAAGLLLIQQRALALAASPKTSPTLLKDLFRIFTYEDRRNDNAHRKEIAAQREAIRQQNADDRRALNEHRKAADLRRLELAEQREKTRAAAFEHQKQIDHHHARLVAQREQTRTRLADLAVRKHADAQKLAEQKQPKHFNQTETTQNIEAIMAFGREFLRQEAAARSRTSSQTLSQTSTTAPQSGSPTQNNNDQTRID